MFFVHCQRHIYTRHLKGDIPPSPLFGNVQLLNGPELASKENEIRINPIGTLCALNSQGYCFWKLLFLTTFPEKAILSSEYKILLPHTGAPEFMLSPPPVVTASENSNFKMKVEMDGNPTPSATFQWLHEGNKVQTIKGTQLYPNVYLSTYALDNIPASYCGRLLAVKASNSLGTSARRSTNVTILRKFHVLEFFVDL